MGEMTGEIRGEIFCQLSFIYGAFEVVTGEMRGFSR